MRRHEVAQLLDEVAVPIDAHDVETATQVVGATGAFDKRQPDQVIGRSWSCMLLAAALALTKIPWHPSVSCQMIGSCHTKGLKPNTEAFRQIVLYFGTDA